MLPSPTSGAARKKIITILGVLLAVNIAVAHIVTGQIANATNRNQVKDDVVVVEEASEVVEEDSTEGDHEEVPSITIYTVKSGDTISSIAQKFGIKQNTILWANEMTAKSTLKVGQALVILPINGVQYTVQKGDTISGIASKFDSSPEDILYFNDLDNPKAIQPGFELIIPDAEPTPAPAKAAPKVATTPKPAVKSTPKVTTPAPVEKSAPAVTSTPTTSAFPETDTHEHEEDEKDTHEEEEEDAPASSGKYGIFIVPAPGSLLTQGYHAVNAVDFGGAAGSTIVAAAEGTVIVAKSGCPLNGSIGSRCNGGFGNFIVISHPGGVQTLYAHLSKVSVTVGDSVDQGDKIGAMGDSGKSTGTHLHFETHGIKNPFTSDKKFTKY